VFGARYTDESMTYPGVVATPGLAPDAAVGVDLIERIGIDDWPRRSEGLTHSQPYPACATSRR